MQRPLALALLLALTGCSTDNGPTFQAEPTPQEIWRQAHCDYMVRCSTQYALLDDCLWYFENRQDLDHWDTYLPQNEQLLSDCAALLAQDTSCRGRNEPAPECAGVERGELTAGADCTDDPYSCAAGYTCRPYVGLPQDNQQCHTCVKDSDPCNEQYPCDDGAECVEHECVLPSPTVELGSECEYDHQCLSGLCIQGECRAFPGEGQACAVDGLRTLCATPLVCVEGICTRFAIPGATGDYCASIFQTGIETCGEGLRCWGFDSEWHELEVPRCQPIPQADERCTTGYEPQDERDAQVYGTRLCAPGLYCHYEYYGMAITGSACKPYLTVGQACYDLAEQPSELGQCNPHTAYCDASGTHTCAHIITLGATCHDHYECATGNCFDGLCAAADQCEL
jgi:hypothetical protein